MTITFRDALNLIGVYLDGRLTGTIKWDGAGWRYFPKGSRVAGERFDSIEAVKKSLIGETA